MERHFQNIFVRVSHKTCKKFAFLEILTFLFSIFPLQSDIYFIALSAVLFHDFLFSKTYTFIHKEENKYIRALGDMTAKNVSFIGRHALK